MTNYISHALVVLTRRQPTRLALLNRKDNPLLCNITVSFNYRRRRRRLLLRSPSILLPHSPLNSDQMSGEESIMLVNPNPASSTAGSPVSCFFFLSFFSSPATFPGDDFDCGRRCSGDSSKEKKSLPEELRSLAKEEKSPLAACGTGSCSVGFSRVS